MLLLACAVGAFLAACGEDGGPAERTSGEAGGKGGSKTVEDELGHQAFQPSTRLVVPAAEGHPFDRAGRVLAGLSEEPLGTRVFVDRRSGGGGMRAWRDVADEEPDGHQLAYVTEGLLGAEGEVGVEDFEMAAQVEAGCAVLVAKGDPEIETLQYEDFEDFGAFLEAARDEPGLVEVADGGKETVYRAGTLALEEEAGIDLSPKTPGGKTPVEAIYDGEVETALMPLDEVLTDVWAGELRAIAVLSAERCPDLPDVPTAEESGHDVTVPVFGGIAAPAGTPRKVVEELGRAFVSSASSPVFRTALRGTGRHPEPKGAEEFARYVETVRQSRSR